MATTFDTAGFATEQGDSSATVGTKDLQLAVPNFALNTTGTLTTAEVTASTAFGTVTTTSGGNSFALLGSFPALQASNGAITTTESPAPPGFGNSLALVGPVLSAQAAAGTSQGETWNLVADDDSMITKGGVWEHTDGNRIVTTVGDKLEVVNGNYLLQVNGGQTVAVTKSTQGNAVCTTTGSPTMPIGWTQNGQDAEPPSAPSPLVPANFTMTQAAFAKFGDYAQTGTYPATSGDVFSGTWANRIMSYVGASDQLAAVVFSETYAGSVTSNTWATGGGVNSNTVTNDGGNVVSNTTTNGITNGGGNVTSTTTAAGAITATQTAVGAITSVNTAGGAASSATAAAAITTTQTAAEITNVNTALNTFSFTFCPLQESINIGRTFGLTVGAATTFQVGPSAAFYTSAQNTVTLGAHTWTQLGTDLKSTLWTTTVTPAKNEMAAIKTACHETKQDAALTKTGVIATFQHVGTAAVHMVEGLLLGGA